jgi:hypothetical protein
LRFLKPCPVRYGRSHVLARFDTHQISNGGAEAINLTIDKTRRLPHGFTAFDHYRLRILLAASGLRPYRRPNHLSRRAPILDLRASLDRYRLVRPAFGPATPLRGPPGQKGLAPPLI